MNTNWCHSLVKFDAGTNARWQQRFQPNALFSFSDDNRVILLISFAPVKWHHVTLLHCAQLVNIVAGGKYCSCTTKHAKYEHSVIFYLVLYNTICIIELRRNLKHLLLSLLLFVLIVSFFCCFFFLMIGFALIKCPMKQRKNLNALSHIEERTQEKRVAPTNNSRCQRQRKLREQMDETLLCSCRATWTFSKLQRYPFCSTKLFTKQNRSIVSLLFGYVSHRGDENGKKMIAKASRTFEIHKHN